MRFILFFTFIYLSSSLFSQTEKPYFQQQVDYTINVKLDDKKHELIATEKIIYTNNSPNTLTSIYFHLWPNAYKKYNTALGNQKLEENSTLLYHAPDSILGFIDGLAFKINDEPLQWDYTPDNEDICIIYLLDPLKPGETVEITTPFNVKIPKGIFSRLGHMGQSYQITQWYPKPAVYDNNGWNQMPYLDQGEFYSEFGTFDVFITLPKNYVVGATGDLIDGENELKWLNEIAEKTAKIDEFDDGDMSFPDSDSQTKTLHYHQEKVHDFAWFADKRYHVLKGEVELPHSKRKVTTWAMFTNNEADLWKKSIEYLNDAIYYYSKWNGDYPYNQATAVDGALTAGGGMEYPNVTVIGESGNDFGLETVIMHEVGHNWFYGILGSNEREHPWMDEGLNSMNENRYIETKYPNRTLIGADSTASKILNWFDIGQYKHKASYELSYLVNARRNLDQPIEFEAPEYTPLNYGGIVYSKTAIAFDYLMAYLGEELYDKCMQRYFAEWKFKHPQPKDLQQIFEEESGKNLSWFFDDLIKTTKKIDYKIVRAKKDTSNAENVLLKIRNKGKIHGPFSISGVSKDGKIISTQWYEPIGNKTFVPFKKGDFDNYRIDAQLDIPEVKRKNNTLQVNGLLRTTEPFRLQWLGSIENPDKTQLFFTPIAGVNMNDKGMIGLAIYNAAIPAKKFEYVLAPMYAPNSENINGYASAFYHIMPNSLFQNIAVGAKSASFSYLRFNTDQNSKGREVLEYYKVTPTIDVTFKKRRARQFSSIYLSLENINIFEEQTPYTNGIYKVVLENYYINRFTVGINNTHPINPFKANVSFQQADDFIKMDITANYRFAYKKPKTGLDIRFFIGRFLDNNYKNNRYNYNLSGNSDYTYDQIYLARNTPNTILNQQFAITDGGFKNYAIAESDGKGVSGNKWLNAINVKSNLFTPAISVYGDFGLIGFLTRDFSGNEIDGASQPAYNLGLALNVVPNIFEIYFPIYMSSDLNQLNYGEKIRFTLNLNTLNPFKMVRNFEL